jgi:hypothetical protein
MPKFDFSGYATKNDLKCSDGRTIKKDAFKDNDGATVPLVWQHLHDDPSNILGHALLENREDGVYVYGIFNDSPAGKNTKELVEHKDITGLSIYANGLIQKGADVLHGAIREVSLVLAGANPGAFIDNLCIEHSDGTTVSDESEAVIYTGLVLEHKATAPVVKDPPPVVDDPASTTDNLTVQEVFDSLTDIQKNVVYAMIAQALDEGDASHSEEDPEDIKHSEGGNKMKNNVFDNSNKDKVKGQTLSHDQLREIVEDAKKCGSFKESFLSHVATYGIENIDLLFPDAQAIADSPDFISRRMDWVQSIIGGTKHSPFSRIKSMAADITADEARALGYVKGNLKKEEVISLLRRITTPTTVYKKQKLDRDDIIDITDLDVVAWLKAEMRVMLDEEIARAVLIGDGRDIESADKIDETCLRPIAFDDEMYAHKVVLPANVVGDALVEAVIRARSIYKGTGMPTFYTANSVIADLLLLKDGIGRRLYTTILDLAAALRVADVVAVEVFETIPSLLGIVVNINDYTIGADKGGEVNMFDDFDIDYNQMKYLMETRISGALTKPKSALVITRSQGTLVSPTVPTFVPSTGVITIPTKTGVVYKVGGVITVGGAMAAMAGGVSATVTAEPDTAYYFAHNIDTDWTFLSTKA